jgi:hypothetical protein
MTLNRSIVISKNMRKKPFNQRKLWTQKNTSKDLTVDIH